MGRAFNRRSGGLSSLSGFVLVVELVVELGRVDPVACKRVSDVSGVFETFIETEMFFLSLIYATFPLTHLQGYFRGNKGGNFKGLERK